MKKRNGILLPVEGVLLSVGWVLEMGLTVWPHWLGPWLVVWFGLLSCLNFDTVDKVVSLRINAEPRGAYLYISQETQFTLTVFFSSALNLENIY